MLDEALDKIKNVVNADFTEVKEPESANVPAKDDITLRRHQLMVGKSADYLQKITEELDVDKKLGLRNQAYYTADRALKEDIDNLLSSRDYIQVSKRDMERLFKIPMLKKMSLIKNISEIFSELWDEGKAAIICFASVLLSFYPMIAYTHYIFTRHLTNVVFCLDVVNVLCWVVEIIFIFGGYALLSECKFHINFCSVKLDSKSLDQVDIKIPYGAKLKVLEAKETGIFKDFLMFFPTVQVDHHEVDMREKFAPLGNFIRAIAQDPAILGVTEDKRMYLIVYWDVKHDIERAVKKIKAFKKFKI